MERRAFSVGGVAVFAAPLVAEAQKPERLYRIGMLERTSATINGANLDGFRQGLRERGYVEGRNFTIEYRSVDGDDQRYLALAADLCSGRLM
jgi:putative tryptophan/tyrosine transport system substrate-binding protein